jgi:AraC-like DNA-binding protein
VGAVLKGVRECGTLLRMQSVKNMIQSSASGKRDRLSAFFQAFELSIRPAEPAQAHLVILGDDAGLAHQVLLCPRGLPIKAQSKVLAAAEVDFGGSLNPLWAALPDAISISTEDVPALRSLVDLFVAEVHQSRCGRQASLDRLCELILLMALRRAMELGSAKPGLLAGLSHPQLHSAIAAMHDEPSRHWTVDELAEVSAMSRGRFIVAFREVVGITPAAYLSTWRLTVGRRLLQRGERVKRAATLVGFGSAEAFSRAYTRAYGHAPREHGLHASA